MSLLKNIPLKLLALSAAILLWFFVVGIENNVYRFPEELDVRAINIPQDLSISSDLDKAKISIRGTPDIVKNLTKSDFDTVVDVKNRKAGEYNLSLMTTSKNEKIAILKLEPVSVHVKLEEIAEKELKIKTILTGSPQKSYIVKEVKLLEETAVIRGSRSLVDKITAVTAEIRLDSSHSANFKINVPLSIAENKNSSFKNVTITPQQVGVEVLIAHELQQKTLVVKPVLKGAADPDLFSKKLIIEPSTVVVQGKDELLQKLFYLETEAVSLEALRTSEKPVIARLVIPKEIALLEEQDNKISITLAP